MKRLLRRYAAYPIAAILIAALFAGCAVSTQPPAVQAAASGMPSPSPSPAAEPAAPPTSTPTPQPQSTAGEEAPLSYEVGLFSWEEDAYGETMRGELYAMLETLHVTELYQCFDGVDLNDGDAQSFMRDMADRGIALYSLEGSREWGLDPDGEGMLAAVARIAEQNRAMGTNAFQGIMFDVESFLNDKWDEDAAAVMDAFISGARLAYQAARENGLYVIHCIPIWYDDAGYDAQLRALINECSDEVAVMNYDRRDEPGNMAYELELSQSAGKKIICIYEFQSTDYHGLTDNETYYNIDGVEAAVASFESLYRRFDYQGLKFAYHYFKPLRDLV